jgi:phosphoribosylformimino-5-aminoimidazole carboxamide ribotide isomerase
VLTRPHEPGTFAVIPAVDVLGDEAVRLEQGAFDRVAVRAGDPEALARHFADAGATLVHVVDLDGARAGRVRPDVLARLVEAARPAAVQASGGVRSLADAERLLEAGAARVVVGTAAFATAPALPAFARALGDRLVVALDVRRGRIAVAGWTRDGGLSVAEAVGRCADAGVARLLCTAIERDGTLAGPDLALLADVRERSGLPVLAAGGIASAEDIAAVAATGCEGAVVGRALLDGPRTTLREWTSAASRASRRTRSPRSTG